MEKSVTETGPNATYTLSRRGRYAPALAGGAALGLLVFLVLCFAGTEQWLAFHTPRSAEAARSWSHSVTGYRVTVLGVVVLEKNDWLGILPTEWRVLPGWSAVVPLAFALGGAAVGAIGVGCSRRLVCRR